MRYRRPVVAIAILIAVASLCSLAPIVLAHRIELTAAQKIVQRRVLANMIDPESVRWERWYPEVAEPAGWSYPYSIVFKGHVFFKIPCDRVVRVIFRNPGGLGECRTDRLYLFDHGEVSDVRERGQTPCYDEVVEHYYPEP